MYVNRKKQTEKHHYTKKNPKTSSHYLLEWIIQIFLLFMLKNETIELVLECGLKWLVDTRTLNINTDIN